MTRQQNDITSIAKLYELEPNQETRDAGGRWVPDEEAMVRADVTCVGEGLCRV